MTETTEILKKIRNEDIRFVDFRFTDPRGQMQHITVESGQANEGTLTDGILFDASSIAGWKAINESDMKLIPDLDSGHIDPFSANATMAFFCDVINPEIGVYYDRDPRGVARKAQIYLRSTGIGDVVNVGPEAEFFVFDDVRFSTDPYNSGFMLDDNELPVNTNREYVSGNVGHRPRKKSGYAPVPPIDQGQDYRSEMLLKMKGMGLIVEKHHHEVAASQHELGIKYDTLLRSADKMQIYKYVVRQVANDYGKTATFMPKPVYGDNGTGMHVNLSIWENGATIFAGNEYAGLSKNCLFFIGGIIKHARSLNAFTNPTTNSYKRLVSGYEAPVLLTYSARNRSAACRIPYGESPNTKRCEVRFPDPGANPYLAFSAILMAGIDGIKNKTHPGKPMDKNLYNLPSEELSRIPTVCGSLRQALECLEENNQFLQEGNVFTKDQIEAYIQLKMEEVIRFEHSPHPVEFDMYYSV